MKRRASGVAIVGAAALPVGRLSPRDSSLPIGLEQDVLSLLVHRTLAETGIGAAEVGSLVLTLPPPSTRQLGLATMLAAHLGLRCTGRIAEVVEMGITGGLAFDQAAADIALGYCNFALALGVNLDGHISAAEAANNGIRAVGDVDFQSPFGITPISWYAFDAARYMYETGATRRDLAAVAVKNRRHAMHNPLAQLRGRPLSESEVLAQRPIVEPLGLLDVPPRGEGAVVLLLASTDAARCSRTGSGGRRNGPCRYSACRAIRTLHDHGNTCHGSTGDQRARTRWCRRSPGCNGGGRAFACQHLGRMLVARTPAFPDRPVRSSRSS
jgi:acetyl-CoA C-acetyltransferase